MTIKEAIDIADAEKPNQYSIDDKVRWLSRLDGDVYSNVITTHHGWDKIKYRQYTADDLDFGLIAPPPYDDMYVAYIKMKIDECNDETGRYNNSAAAFNELYTEFQKFWNRTHMPLGRDMVLYGRKDGGRYPWPFITPLTRS